MIRTTSKAAYQEHKETGRLGQQQEKILIYLLHVPDASRREIAEALRMETSSVSGRVREMLDDNVISECPMPRKCNVTRKTIRPVRA